MSATAGSKGTVISDNALFMSELLAYDGNLWDVNNSIRRKNLEATIDSWKGQTPQIIQDVVGETINNLQAKGLLTLQSRTVTSAPSAKKEEKEGRETAKKVDGVARQRTLEPKRPVGQTSRAPRTAEQVKPQGEDLLSDPIAWVKQYHIPLICCSAALITFEATRYVFSDWMIETPAAFVAAPAAGVLMEKAIPHIKGLIDQIREIPKFISLIRRYP